MQTSTESSVSKLHYYTRDYDLAYPEGTKIYLLVPQRCIKTKIVSLDREIRNPPQALMEMVKKDPSVEMPVCSLPAAMWKFEH